MVEYLERYFKSFEFDVGRDTFVFDGLVLSQQCDKPRIKESIVMFTAARKPYQIDIPNCHTIAKSNGKKQTLSDSGSFPKYKWSDKTNGVDAQML